MHPSAAGLILVCVIMVLWEVIGTCCKLLCDRRRHRQSIDVVENINDLQMRQQRRLHSMLGPRLGLPIHNRVPDPLPRLLLVPEKAAAVVVDPQKLDEIMKNCTECVICLQGFDCEQAEIGCQILPECGHRFHPSCIRKWFKISCRRTCPVCRHCTY